MTVQGWSGEQQLAALERANEIRSYRAAKKKEIKAGVLPADWFLVHGPHDPMLLSMRVSDALRAMPGLGGVRVAGMMRKAQIAPSRTLGAISPQQWERLYAALEESPTLRVRLSAARGKVRP